MVRVTTSRRVVREQRDRAGLPAGELGVRLVDDHDAGCRRRADGARSAGDSAVPVGLLGRREDHVGALLGDGGDGGVGRSRLKSAARPPGTHSVWVPSEMIGCIEYDGTKPIALRPGPPKACSSCCRISLDPLAAQRFSRAELRPGLHA